MTAILTGHFPGETVDLSARLPWRHPDEKPTFAARARNSARRLGLFTLEKPHIWKADGVWCRTRCLDLYRGDLNERAMDHVETLREAGA